MRTRTKSTFSQTWFVFPISCSYTAFGTHSAAPAADTHCLQEVGLLTKARVCQPGPFRMPYKTCKETTTKPVMHPCTLEVSLQIPVEVEVLLQWQEKFSKHQTAHPSTGSNHLCCPKACKTDA
ncbi:vacuolar protein sorting-associated protein 26B [Platysternon megacephalum]|uniref:Vacuolar protein sorting-associated protein 26B n=1 Tax=Platysternon megacephalum TaxID=55544 RepID=A0A4D9E950_9SAUR|nr:vacuolar protein sorting-associated protein 26B [Platysternon megacephalum]